MRNSSLSTRVRAARLLAVISARELDWLADLTPGHAAMIERGQRPRLEVETAKKLALVFGVSLDWLVSGTGSAPSGDSVSRSVATARAVAEKRDAAKKRASRRLLPKTGTEG